MGTACDRITVAIFADLIMLFLQRSTAEVHVDKMIDYLPAALCCALATISATMAIRIWPFS